MIRILAVLCALVCVSPTLAQVPKEQAPASYKVKFDTSKGTFTVQVTRAWAPQAADPLLQSGKERLLRRRSFLPRHLGLHGAVRHQRQSGGDGGLAGFADQGRSGRPEQQARLHHLRHGRTEHAHVAGLHQLHRQQPAGCFRLCAFRPGRVRMDVVDKLNAEYGEGAPGGRGPDQSRMQREGNAYLTKDFSRLDFVKKATIQP
ncbi:MAG: hypothetical protein WDN48_17765 [Pseudolabrys sp.]